MNSLRKGVFAVSVFLLLSGFAFSTFLVINNHVASLQQKAIVYYLTMTSGVLGLGLTILLRSFEKIRHTAVFVILGVLVGLSSVYLIVNAAISNVTFLGIYVGIALVLVCAFGGYLNKWKLKQALRLVVVFAVSMVFGFFLCYGVPLILLPR